MVDNQIRPICTNISNRQVNVSANHYIDDEEWLNQREFFDKLNAFRQTNSDLCCSQRPLRLVLCSKLTIPLCLKFCHLSSAFFGEIKT